MGIALLVYLTDGVIAGLRDQPKKFKAYQWMISTAYMFGWFFSFMNWSAYNEIIFPNNFKGEATMIFGIDGYPALPPNPLWKKSIYIPADGIFITASTEVDALNSYRFKRANGDKLPGDFSMSFNNSYSCFKNNKGISHLSFNVGADPTGVEQAALAALCNQINNGQLQTNHVLSPLIMAEKENSYLSVQGKGLSALPDAVGDLRVKEVILTSNGFVSIPKQILMIQGLETLLTGYNPITDLTGDIYQMKDLKRLSLNNTGVRNITADLSSLSNLMEIDLSGNKLHNLPEQVKTLPNLKELEINNNAFKDFTFVDSRVQNLEVLYLHSNRIQGFTGETKHLRQLKELLIFDNEIDSLPDNIKDLRSLEKLEIWDNPISYISPKIAELTKLRNLILDDDNLTAEQKRNLKEWLPYCAIDFQTRSRK